MFTTRAFWVGVMFALMFGHYGCFRLLCAYPLMICVNALVNLCGDRCLYVVVFVAGLYAATHLQEIIWDVAVFIGPIWYGMFDYNVKMWMELLNFAPPLGLTNPWTL